MGTEVTGLPIPVADEFESCREHLSRCDKPAPAVKRLRAIVSKT